MEDYILAITPSGIFICRKVGEEYHAILQCIGGEEPQHILDAMKAAK